MIETALLGLCAAGVKIAVGKVTDEYGRMAIEIGGELATVVFAHDATEKIHKLQERFSHWIPENHRPGNEDLEKAVARAAILADLFCLMEAEPCTIEDHGWMRCATVLPEGAARDLASWGPERCGSGDYRSSEGCV